jgi:hypothetical protein
MVGCQAPLLSELLAADDREGQGSLMQCVITPAAPYMPWTNEAIAAETDKQVRGPPEA